MRKKYRTIVYLTIFAILAIFVMPSCKKDVAHAEVELSYRMLEEKTWYLDYVQTITGTTVNTRTYIGQSTYFINFLADRTTLDSDGINGTYTVTDVNGQLSINVVAKTSNGNAITYSYHVESMGSKTLVLSYLTGSTKNKLFYTSN